MTKWRLAMNKNGILIRTEYNELFIPIYDRITVITGDSANGKTKMMKFLDACKKAKNNNVKVTSNVDINDIILVYDECTLQLLLEKRESKKIIFIDRFNRLFSKELLHFMQESDNIFIILGHRNISELTSQDAVLYMICDGSNYRCEQVYKNGILNPLQYT